MSEWHFTYEGEPIPKGRPRAMVVGSKPRMYTPKRTKDAEEDFANQFKAEVVGGPFPLSGPVRVAMLFRTKSQTVDLDNLIKTVWDSLNGIAWEDDKQIVHVRADIVRGVTDPSTDLTIIWS